jgi:hypothetical protein
MPLVLECVRDACIAAGIIVAAAWLFGVVP